LESTVVCLIVACSLAVLFDVPRRDFLDYPMPVVFLMTVVIAHPIETLIFQAFPIFVVRVCRGSNLFQIAVSTILFSAAHFPEGVATGIVAGIIGGLYYSFAYCHWRSRSRWKSLWVTAGCHAIHNGIAFILLVILGNWS
jgi:membrane protease YdiL (CAAX protease family)